MYLLCECRKKHDIKKEIFFKELFQSYHIVTRIMAESENHKFSTTTVYYVTTLLSVAQIDTFQLFCSDQLLFTGTCPPGIATVLPAFDLKLISAKEILYPQSW